MKNSPHPILFLTPSEVRAIQTWIEQNGYCLTKGQFTLVYDFWILGANIRIHWDSDNEAERDWLEVRDSDNIDDPNNMLNTIEVAGRSIKLALSEELSRQWISDAAVRTEAEINADCEPSGSSLFLKIQRDRTQIRIKNEWHNLASLS